MVSINCSTNPSALWCARACESPGQPLPDPGPLSRCGQSVSCMCRLSLRRRLHNLPLPRLRPHGEGHGGSTGLVELGPSLWELWASSSFVFHGSCVFICGRPPSHHVPPVAQSDTQGICEVVRSWADSPGSSWSRHEDTSVETCSLEPLESAGRFGPHCRGPGACMVAS